MSVKEQRNCQLKMKAWGKTMRLCLRLVLIWRKDDKEDTFKKCSRACKRFSLLSLRCLKGIDIWCTSAIKEVIRLSMLLLMPVVMIIGMHLVASFSGSILEGACWTSEELSRPKCFCCLLFRLWTGSELIQKQSRRNSTCKSKICLKHLRYYWTRGVVRMNSANAAMCMV